MRVLSIFSMFLTSLMSLYLGGCILPVYHKTQLVNFKSHSPVMHNERAAISIDVVAILNEDLHKKLKNMKSAEYFQEIQSLSTLKPNEIVVWRFEQIQMTSIDLQRLIWPVKQCMPYGILIFADFRNHQDNKIEVPYNATGVEIVLGADAIASVDFQYKVKPGQPKEYNQIPRSTNLEKPIKK